MFKTLVLPNRMLFKLLEILLVFFPSWNYFSSEIEETNKEKLRKEMIEFNQTLKQVPEKGKI